MLSALLKKQLQEIFRSYFYNAKQGKARSRVSTVRSEEHTSELQSR